MAIGDKSLPGLRDSSSEDKREDIPLEDIPDFDKPPKRERSKQKQSPKRKTDNKTRPPGMTAKTDITEDLMAVFGQIGAAIMAMGAANPKLTYDGQVILKNSAALADALNELGKKNPAVQRVLHAMISGTSATMVVAALGNIAIPIMANHGLLPAQAATLMGADEPPENTKKKEKPQSLRKIQVT